MAILRDLHHDAKLLMASRGIRAFAFSYLNVVFAIYLDRLGYSPVTIGIVYSVAYLSGAVLTAVWGYLSDRYGRRKILMLLAVLTIISNGIFVFFSGLVFILLAVIIANVGAGGSGGGGSGGGPFNPVEEALLAEKCQPENRNQIFALNAFVGSVMGAIGALAAGLPQFLQERAGWDSVSSYKPLFVLTILFSVGLVIRLSCHRRTAPTAAKSKRRFHTPPACSSPRCRFSLSSTTSAPAWPADWFPTGSFSASASTSNLSVCFFSSPIFSPPCHF